MSTPTQMELPDPLTALLDRLGDLLHADDYGAVIAKGMAPYSTFEHGHLVCLHDAEDDEPCRASSLWDVPEHPDHPAHDRLMRTWALGPRGYLLAMRAAKAREAPWPPAVTNTNSADAEAEAGPRSAAVGEDRWVDEEEICAQLKVSHSHLRRLLARVPADLAGAPVTLPGRGKGQRKIRRWRSGDVQLWLEAVTAWERGGARTTTRPRKKKVTPTGKGVVDWNEPVATLLK